MEDADLHVFYIVVLGLVIPISLAIGAHMPPQPSCAATAADGQRLTAHWIDVRGGVYRCTYAPVYGTGTKKNRRG